MDAGSISMSRRCACRQVFAVEAARCKAAALGFDILTVEDSRGDGKTVRDAERVMANPISPELTTGTVGELLVQLRLLQFGVQAAPPLKDSGNDLIALREFAVRCIQVKTTSDACPPWPPDTKRYHLLSIVRLAGSGCNLLLDDTKIYLLNKDELAQTNHTWEGLEPFLLRGERVDEVFRS
jgi:hypothetical protein